MIRCGNCGEYVTKDYARVFTPDDVDHPRVCPECEDLVRRRGKVDEARTQARSSTKRQPGKGGKVS